MVPGLTDDDENIGKMGAFVAGLRNVRYMYYCPTMKRGWTNTAARPDHGMPPTPTPSPERMAQLAEKLRRFES